VKIKILSCLSKSRNSLDTEDMELFGLSFN
jgi:hypothetical protein